MDEVLNEMAKESDLPVLSEAPSIEPTLSEDKTVTLFTQSEDEVGDEAELVM